MFGGYVFVDKIPNNESDEPAIHIYTRPFDLSSVKLRDSLSIYTTAIIKSVMIFDDTNSKLRDSVEILNTGDVSFNIELPNEETLWICTYSCNSKSLNVIVLFEYCNRYSLYAGRFIASDSMLFKDSKSNKSLRILMQQKKIDDLYIDVTTACIYEANLKYSACQEIESLIKSKDFKDYKFHMLVNEFGYEDLLFMLAKRDIRIYLGDERLEIFKRQDILHYFCNDPNEADIILVNRLDINSIEKQFVEEKIISIEFTPDDKLSDSNGLQFIKFSIHPTMPDINYIATLAAPLHIYTIGHSIDFPFKLDDFCRFNENSNKTKSNKTT